MQIISHRGYWKEWSERNQRIAFERSFENGMGTETDLRDICGKIVISHDMPKGNEVTFEEVLQIMDGRNLPLALNIKADGQIDEILRLLKKYNHTNYFTFDMSIPDMVFQATKDAKIFCSYSDLMSSPLKQVRYDGIWLDSFNKLWWTTNILDELVENYKTVCIVSEDLHKRDNEKQWNLIKKSEYFNTDDLILCTDYPDPAIEFFGVSK